MSDIVLVLLGLTGLFIGGDWLVKGASRVASSFGISSLIIGLTIVSVGTSAPELLVSVSAALQGSSDIAVGNVVGSNIANIGLILGLTGLVSPMSVKAILVRREIPILMAITIATYLLLLDASISRVDGLLLLFGFIVFNAWFYYLARQEHEEHEEEIAAGHEVDTSEEHRVPVEVVRLVIGTIVLVLGANWLVTGASSIAREFGVPELVIGITMVAFGTSLPELAASLTAAFRGESDIAVGNVIGSNIVNLLLILGATAFVQPIDVDAGLLQFEFVVMIGFTILLFPFAGTNLKLSRWESALFLGAYLGFIAWIFLTG